MQIVNPDSKLSDLLASDPAIITVLNRFGIMLGVSDKTISKICDDKGIDKAFLTTMLNTYINEDYFPQKMLSQFSANKIIDYLNKTNDYYLYYLIPNIERHLNYLLAKSDSGNSSLAIIQRFFLEVKQELQTRINDDKQNWFPAVQMLECSIGNIPPHKLDAKPSQQEDSIESKVSDLLNMFIMHLTGPYDINLAHAVLTAIYGLKKDISQNNRIRERILRPLHEALLNAN
ncbi:MAG: helix-turn-helix transcriptional regulator [Muribaculaceae bacterium]